jgi:hypothetical protein
MNKKSICVIMSLFVAFFLYFNVKANAYIIETKTAEETAVENVQLQQIADEVGVGNYKGLSRWLATHIRYKEDRTPADEWKEPHTTLTDGTGDCEDYAILTLEVLKRMGIHDVFLLGVSSKTRNIGHVVTIFRENKKQVWSYYNFEKLETGKQKFDDLVYAVARECRYGSKIEYLLADGNRKNVPPSEEKANGLRD